LLIFIYLFIIILLCVHLSSALHSLCTVGSADWDHTRRLLTSMLFVVYSHLLSA